MHWTCIRFINFISSSMSILCCICRFCNACNHFTVIFVRGVAKNRHSEFIAYIRTSAAHTYNSFAHSEWTSAKCLMKNVENGSKARLFLIMVILAKLPLLQLCVCALKWEFAIAFAGIFCKFCWNTYYIFSIIFHGKNMNDSIFVIVSYASENRMHRMVGHFS